MLQAEVQAGKRYRIHHNSGEITVKILGTVDYRTHLGYQHYGSKIRYRCLNERTGRIIEVKSAAKFRAEVN